MRRFFPAFVARSRPPAARLLGPSVGVDGDLLRSVLVATGPTDLSAYQIRTAVEGNLWMLAPEAFRYYLPALMSLAVEHYASLRSFVAELVCALTEPRLDDIVQELERVSNLPPGMALPPETLRELWPQQLNWFNSGEPLAAYRERSDDLSVDERTAILDFLILIRDAHGSDFPLGELQIAIDRLTAGPEKGWCRNPDLNRGP